MQADEAEALWYVAPGVAEIRAEPLPPPRAGEVRVRAVAGALSRGTERLVFSGRVPESEFARMRGPGMAGDFPFPVKYGYATVGIVEAGPEALRGRTVFALHPHQTVFVLPADAVTVVPASMPPRRAALAANMETALNAIWDAGAAPADRIAVVGGGTVGCLCAWLCGRLPGAEVTLLDVDAGRASVAHALGVGFLAPDAAPQDCDLVIHASASAEGLATAIRLAGEEATVLELSWFGSEDVRVPLGGAFHSRRLRLQSSQVGKVSAHHRPRWTHARRMAAAMALLDAPELDALLAPDIDFHALPSALEGTFAPAGGVLTQTIRYPATRSSAIRSPAAGKD